MHEPARVKRYFKIIASHANELRCGCPSGVHPAKGVVVQRSSRASREINFRQIE
jgi:hypothetical protein